MTTRQAPHVLGARHLHAARLMDFVWWGMAVAIVLGVAVPTVVGIVESFANLYDWARENGVDDPMLALAWPAMIDTFIIAGEAGALVGAIDRWPWHQRLLPWSMVALGLGASLAFNVANETEFAAQATAGAAPVAAFLGLLAASQFVKRTISAALDTEQGRNSDTQVADTGADPAASAPESRVITLHSVRAVGNNAGTAAAGNGTAASPSPSRDEKPKEKEKTEEVTEAEKAATYDQNEGAAAARHNSDTAAEQGDAGARDDATENTENEAGTTAAKNNPAAPRSENSTPEHSNSGTAPDSTETKTQSDGTTTTRENSGKSGTAGTTPAAGTSGQETTATARQNGSAATGTSETSTPRNGATAPAANSEPMEGATGPIGTDLEWEALTLLASEPEITGAELGRRLGRGPETGERLLAKLLGQPTS